MSIEQLKQQYSKITKNLTEAENLKKVIEDRKHRIEKEIKEVKKEIEDAGYDYKELKNLRAQMEESLAAKLTSFEKKSEEVLDSLTQMEDLTNV